MNVQIPIYLFPPLNLLFFLVVAGTVVGIFAVLALGLLCTSTVMFIKKSKRVKGTFKFTPHNVSKFNGILNGCMLWMKVSAIRSRILEHKNSKMHKKCDVKSEKGI